MHPTLERFADIAIKGTLGATIPGKLFLDNIRIQRAERTNHAEKGCTPPADYLCSDIVMMGLDIGTYMGEGLPIYHLTNSSGDSKYDSVAWMVLGASAVARGLISLAQRSEYKKLEAENEQFNRNRRNPDSSSSNIVFE